MKLCKVVLPGSKCFAAPETVLPAMISEAFRMASNSLVLPSGFPGHGGFIEWEILMGGV